MEEFINFTAKIIKFVIMVAAGLVLTIGPIIMIFNELQTEGFDFASVALWIVGSALPIWFGSHILSLAFKGWEEDTL